MIGVGADGGGAGERERETCSWWKIPPLSDNVSLRKAELKPPALFTFKALCKALYRD